MSIKNLVNSTTTPLASIFGSGFLVVVPILAAAVGPWSAVAMAAICGLGYAVGIVIRHNIAHAEPLLAANAPGTILSLERLSDVALVFSYVVSVSLYLHIMATFVLSGLGLDTEFNENLLTSVTIVFITVIGTIKGLKPLERLEKYALGITLVIIALLLVGFAAYDLSILQSSAPLSLPMAEDHTQWEVLTIVAGTLIVVQGFETPRYMGGEFDAATRIRASRWSQIITTIVYVTFVALALPLVPQLNGQYDGNSLIKLAAIASAALVIPLIIAAALSQFSAAVADTLAAAGDIAELGRNKINARVTYVLIGAGAIMVTWTADTFQIIALASRAFAAYYLLQCLVAMATTTSVRKRLMFGVIAASMGFIAVFAVPAG